MSSIDTAIAELHSSDTPSIAAVARKHNLKRNTLSRRFHGKSVSKAKCNEIKQNLMNKQEEQLAAWIGRQCLLCLHPAPAIVRKIVSDMVGKPISTMWSSRFVSRNKHVLDCKYLNILDFSRHHADAGLAYAQYFDLIGTKIEEYGITRDNIYNMDGKGFSIGLLQKSQRIFTRETYMNNNHTRIGQDGNREWVSILVTVCCDGTQLPPGIIFTAYSGLLYDDWLEDFDPEQHEAHFASIGTGWTTNEHGLGWLRDIFDDITKAKAKRSWRLLFVDGHGHRLQPLDVGCFGPLAQYYAHGLNELISQGIGFVSIKKRDFFALFNEAYKKTFSKEVIESAWCKTGIWPFNPNIVLDLLPKRPQTPDKSGDSTELLSSSQIPDLGSLRNRPRFRKKLRNAKACADPKSAKILQGLENQLLLTSAELCLTKIDVNNLRASLTKERKQKSRRKKVLEQIRSEDGAGAVFISPSRVRRARELNEARAQEELQKKAEKQKKKDDRIQKKAAKDLEREQKRQTRDVAAKERKELADQKKAAAQAEKEEKKANKQAEIEAKSRTKAQSSQVARKIVGPRLKPVPLKPIPDEPVIQAKTRSRGVIKQPARFRGSG